MLQTKSGEDEIKFLNTGGGSDFLPLSWRVGQLYNFPICLDEKHCRNARLTQFIMNISHWKGTEGQTSLSNEGFDLHTGKIGFCHYSFAFWFPRGLGFWIREQFRINLWGAHEDTARWVLLKMIIVQKETAKAIFHLAFSAIENQWLWEHLKS